MTDSLATRRARVVPRRCLSGCAAVIHSPWRTAAPGRGHVPRPRSGRTRRRRRRSEIPAMTKLFLPNPTLTRGLLTTGLVDLPAVAVPAARKIGLTLAGPGCPGAHRAPASRVQSPCPPPRGPCGPVALERAAEEAQTQPVPDEAVPAGADRADGGENDLRSRHGRSIRPAHRREDKSRGEPLDADAAG
jgi:hypothetical protein